MIRYTELTENNREAFRGYISEDIFSRLSGQGVKAIGALEETDKGETISAGALVFTVKEEEQEIAASVQWLYVGASYRGQGIADGLMERMFDVLSFLGDYRLTCNIPETLEFDEVLLFFRSWGFDFDRTELFEYSLSIKDILRSPFLEKEIDTSDIAPLTEVRGEEWQRLRKRVKERLKSRSGDRERLLSLLETELEGLDQVLSCAAKKDGEIEALCLWKAYDAGTSGLIEPALLVDISGGNELLLLKLIGYSAKLLEGGPPDVILRVICRDGKVERLFRYLFPEERPDVSRRGVFAVSE